jgi:hypothetical protein
MTLDITTTLGAFALANGSLKLFHVGNLDTEEVELIAKFLTKEFDNETLKKLVNNFKNIAVVIDRERFIEHDSIPF